jgi:hypothetical protein
MWGKSSAGPDTTNSLIDCSHPAGIRTMLAEQPPCMVQIEQKLALPPSLADRSRYESNLER